VPTIKQLETALINADKAGDEAAARALAAEIKRLRAQQAQAPKPTTAAGKPSGRLGAFGAGIAEAIPRVIGAGLELFAPSGQKIATPEQERARQQQFAGARQVAPNFFTAGQITGEVLATAPVVGGVGKGIEKIGGAAVKYAPKAGRAAAAVARGGRVAQRVGRATQTGGIGSGRTAAETVRLGRGARVGQLAERVAGGAIGGATGAALTGQDVTEGALFGGGLPVVGSVLKRVAGFAGDITKLPRQKAAEIIRKSLGENVDEARAAFAQLSPDDQRLAEQVLIDAGVEPDAFFGVGKAIQEQTVSGATPMREALEAQAQARGQRLAQAALGETAAERRAALEAGQRGVSAITTPLREQAMEMMAPIPAQPMVTALREQAAMPGVRSSTGKRALLRLAKDIEANADVDGFIDPADLYTLRKEASDIVEKFVGSPTQPSSGSKRRAASLVIDFKNMVDEALGPEFQDYLSRHRTGMEAINRQELAAKGAQLAAERPDEFIALMSNQRPKIVEDIMGRGAGNYDIVQAFEADPARYMALKQSADELATLNRMAELRSSGTGAAGNIMVTQTPTRMSRGLATLAGIPYTPLGFAARGGEQVERAFMAPRVERELAQAYLSGPAMNQLLNTMPSKALISERVSSMSPMARNVFAQLLREYMTTPSSTYVE
jgi:hypothetical protein